MNWTPPKPEPPKCRECGQQPVHVTANGEPCEWCKACLAKRLVGDLDALRL